MQTMKVDTFRALRRIAIAQLPTEWGESQAIGCELQSDDGIQRLQTAIVLILGKEPPTTPLVRIHSECLTGDVLGSLRCDCGDQLELAMRAIPREGSGLLIYEQQEGRGIGLMAKLQA